MKQEERKRRTREKIFQALRDLLAEDLSIDEIKMQDIVHRSDLSRTTLYQYFESVGDIAAAMGGEGIDRWLGAFTPPEQWTSTPLEGLIWAYGHLARIVRGDRAVWAAMAQTGGMNRPPMRAAVVRMQKMLVQILGLALKKREIASEPTVNQRAYILNTTQMGLCLEWASGNGPRGSLRNLLSDSVRSHMRKN